jgi:2-dehydro-3-deoxyglucarate aldolase/4-hydroxy-2-oxoheptanedioate aldolase
MNLKQRLNQGEHLLGTMVTTFASADMAKLLMQYGFDFFIIDCEHGAFTTREAADMIAVARAVGLPVMVRIPEMRREHALKFTEMGANGLLLPNTESAEQARMLVDCTKYAPMGHRGVSLSRPHTDFAKVDGRNYMAQANAENILLCQIESRAGVANIDEIMAVDGIDAALIGPNDMTQDYGKLNQFDDPEIVEAFERVIASAKTRGKFSGAHFGASAPLIPWISRGMQLNMWNSDIGLMSLGAAGGLPALRSAGK